MKDEGLLRWTKILVSQMSTCVGAAQNVSPNWSLETMTCQSFFPLF